MATVYGTGVQFGVPYTGSPAIQLSNLESNNTSQTTEVLDRNGTILAWALYANNKYEVSGDYTYTGTQLSASVALTGLAALDPLITGNVIVTEAGSKTSNNQLRSGHFKGISVLGVN